MKRNIQLINCRITSYLACLLFCISFVATAQTQAIAQLPAYFSPLNPNRPDHIDLEVNKGTTSLKTVSTVYNKTEKNYKSKGIVTTTLNHAGKITSIKKKLSISREYEIENRTYDSFNRLTKKEHFFILGKDTLSEITKISYTGSNPLVAKWETNTAFFYEKMYFDRQGVVTKKETMETLEDNKSIYSIETYDPTTQQGTFVEMYPEGGSDQYNITYQDGKKVSEVALSPNSEFKTERIYLDTLGSIIKINKRYTEHTSEIPYLEKKLYYSNNMWFGAISTIDYDADLKPNETAFMFREIGNSNGVIKPSKEIADKIYNEVENPKSKLPF